jgi:hypothetical protein
VPTFLTANIRRADKSFKYLVTGATNKNYIQEEIERRLNLGNVGYHVVQDLLSFRLLSKNVKVYTHRTAYMHGC